MSHRKDQRCADCGAAIAGGKTGFCCHCVNNNISHPWRKFPWTPAWDAMLREGYAKCVLGKPTVAIDRVQKATGYPRYIVRLRAQRLGIARDTRRPWQKPEEDFLCAMAGSVSAKEIARMLGRSHSGVLSHMEGMRLRAAVTSGYSISQLADALGVSCQQVRTFLQRGWIGMNASHRIPASNVRFLLIERMDHLDFRLMNQRWLKDQVRALLQIPTSSARRAA